MISIETPIQKIAITSHPVHPLIAHRWSPRAFEDRPIGQDEINSLIEAARWAPSSVNEQPWRFIYAHRGENAFDLILSTFSDSNKVWAASAPLLILTLVKKTHSMNGNPNRSAHHDLGLAVANLSLQATHLGIGVHQIGGFSPAKAKESFNIPDDYEVVTGLVLGYFGSPDRLPDHLRERELAPRKRKELHEIAFHGAFNT